MVVMELTLPGLAAASSAKTPLTRCSFPSAASADCVASRVTHRFRMAMLPPRSCPILGLAHHCTGGHQTGGARTTRVIGDAMSTAIGSGTKDDPWRLKTAPGVSEDQMYRDASADPPELVCQVGGTQLRYLLSSVDELHAMLRTCDDWVPLGRADEQKPALGGTVEAGGRSQCNPA